MSPYFLINYAYHLVVPSALRNQIYRCLPTTVRRVRSRIIRSLEMTASHDEIYCQSYFAQIEALTVQSADTVAKSIVEAFAPQSVVDLGCGGGLLMQALKERGVRCRGFEYASAGIELCRARGLEVSRFDIEKDVAPKLQCDVAMCTEVAEHLPSSCADRLVDLLCGWSDVVVFTAATPGQGGTEHINEQPHEYWIRKFESKGFHYDTISTRWRTAWSHLGVATFYSSNAMVFVKSAHK